MRILRALVRNLPVIGGVLVVFALGIGLGAVIVPPLVDRYVPAPAVSSSQPSASPSATAAGGILMNGVPVNGNTDCSGCHKSANGVMAAAVTPALAHPLQGCTHCTQCHSDSRLVPTAPGHQSFSEDQCLACHKEQGQGNAPSRPHHVYQGKDCTSCHNGKTTAPLPADMKGRNACWLCHHDAPGQSLFPSAPPAAAPSPKN